jgi:hypothetical protein
MNWTWKLATDGHGCTRINCLAIFRTLHQQFAGKTVGMLVGANQDDGVEDDLHGCGR